MMSSVPDFASLFAALGWAVIHFTWQGALIGLVVATLLTGLRHSNAAARYALACAALTCCIIAFVVTFVLMLSGSATAPQGAVDVEYIESLLQTAEAPNRLPSLIAWLWIAGVMFGSARFFVQWVMVWRLRTVSTSLPDPAWQEIFDSLRRELGVSRKVRLLRSGLAEAPMVVGWLSPLVLVPASAFTSLTPDQLRSILAHELSHIRRADHLVNAVQVVIETILFFHPVVWWLSREIRLERENCCDDVAVRTAGSPKILAEALAQIESLRLTHPRAALAANGGPLMNRIVRILGTKTANRSASPRWPGVAALVAAAVMTAGGLAHATALNSMVEPPTEAEIDAYLEAVIVKLQEGIAAGQITPDQANAKLDAVRSHLHARAELADHLDKVAAKLRAGVESGQLSADEARAKYEWAQREVADRADAAQHMHAVAAEIHAMMVAGKLSPEEAEAKLAAMHKANSEKAAVAKSLDSAVAEIHAAVEAGKISPEQARQKMEALHATNAARAYVDRDLALRADRLEQAVHAGKLSPEEAKAKLGELHRVRAVKDQWSDVLANELDVQTVQLHNAVLAGKLTPEDAELKMVALRKLLQEKAAMLHTQDVAAPANNQLTLREAYLKQLQLLELADAEQVRRDAHIKTALAILQADVATGEVKPEHALAQNALLKKTTTSKPALTDAMKTLLDQLRAEVKSGAMTVEEAQDALEALKTDLARTEKK